jgi:hypothetical protein
VRKSPNKRRFFQSPMGQSRHNARAQSIAVLPDLPRS